MGGTIFFVHAVDTEGPLYESLDATFGRIKESFQLELEPSLQTLEKLRRKEIPLYGKEDVVADLVRGDRLNCHDTWDKIIAMHHVLMSHEFRSRLLDSWGQKYCFNWFCLDHVGYVRNPRRRAIGFHAVFEQYTHLLEEFNCARDRIYRHHHPLSFSRDAHRHGGNYSFSNLHNEILARRIIDHLWFPVANREGISENMDINLWLEQWIPFDFANLNTEKDEGLKQQQAAGRTSALRVDWRGAPTDWSIYNPSVWDHRKSGQLKRYIARSLNLNARHSCIDEYELGKAFRQANDGQDVLVSYTNHDFRDMVTETQWIVDLIGGVARNYPNVRFRWSTAVEAMRAVLQLTKKDPPRFQIRLENNLLHVLSDQLLWGPQPFLAILTKEGNYYHDNFIINGETSWVFPFDYDTISLDAVASVGVATNDSVGNTTVVVCDVKKPNEWRCRFLNTDDWVENA